MILSLNTRTAIKHFTIFVILQLWITETTFGQNQVKVIDSLTELLKTAKEDTSKVNILNSISGIYRKTDDFKIALTYANNALALAEKISYKKGISVAYNKLGNIYIGQDNYPEAMKSYLTALKIFEEIGYKKGVADIYNNIGIVYYGQDNYPEALKSYQEGLKIAVEINYKESIAQIDNNIGIIYTEMGNYQEAIKNFLAALKIEELLGDKQSSVAYYCNLGDLYLRLKKPEEAKIYIDKGLLLAEETGRKMGIAMSYLNTGKLNMQLQQLPEAKEYLDKGLKLSKEIGVKYLVRDCYSGLSELDSITGDFKSANHYLVLSDEMKDSILNENSNKVISQLRIQYESDKKDEQIKTEQLQNKIIQTREYYGMAISLMVIGIIALVFYLSYLRNRKRKNEYEHMLTDLELTVLKSQLNPHFISNSLINIKEFIDQQPEKVDQFLSNFARLMRKVLEQNEKQLTSLKEELETAELYMKIESIKLRHGFDYRFNCDASIDQEIFMVPPLILQPVIENAIWHGLIYKPERGQITIGINFENDLLKFTIEDNGVGQELKMQNENNRPLEKKSFGLSITRKRIKLLSKEYKANGYFNLTFLEERTIAEIALPSIHF